MSYLFRPTPVFNPGPSRDVVLSRLPAGTMRGYVTNVDWHGFFEEKRRACQGKPWIVRSGTMGNFGGMGDAASDIMDYSNLPLTTVDTSISLAPLAPALPVDLYPMPAPIAPPIVAYTPGTPPIVSSGGSILSQAASGVPSWLTALQAALPAATAIAKSATSGGGINPAIPPAPPSGRIAVAPASGNFFTQSSIISGLPNWGVLAGGAAIVAVAVAVARGGKRR